MLGNTFLLVALLTLDALAAPTSIKKRFSVQQRDVAYRSGPHAMTKAYRKYGWDTGSLLDSLNPASLVEALQSKAVGSGSRSGSGSGASTGSGANDNESGTVDAEPEQNDTEFLAPVIVGGQTLAMNFDTGSSDLWVYSTELPPASRAGHTAFDPSQSSTFRFVQGSTWKIQYGDGSTASGNVGLDVVNIGGASFPNQVVELATNISDSFVQDVNSDGLVGLAFSSLNTVKPRQAKTFFENILPELDEPVFTAALKHAGTGTYNFGFIDEKQHKGPITYVPVDSASGFWQFSSEGAQVGGQDISNSGGEFIADTGTTLILVSLTIASGYWNQVSSAENDASQGGFTFDCSEALPTFSLKITGNYTADVPGDLVNFAGLGRGRCFGGIQAGGGDLMVLGDIFLKSQFVVFNGATKALGFAPTAV